MSAFPGLGTSRLKLRKPAMGDLAALVDRRSEPSSAAFQSWTVPFPEAEARRLLEGVVATDGPPLDSWWMITLERMDDQVVVGDLAVRFTWDGRCAEVGYTLAREHWGDGYATEALTELVRWLFEDVGVTRVHAQLHPDNLASASVLERTGFVFEGHTRLSFWVGDENSDDWLYGMTRAGWDAWTARAQGRPDEVRLIEIDHQNQHAVRALGTHHSQRRLASPVVDSFADALFPEWVDGAPVVPWMRAIEADGELAGFVMVALTTEAHPEPFLWRLSVDRMHQRRGIGDVALDLVIEELRSMGDTALLTSWVDGHGSPRPFYERRGFVDTGVLVDGEIEARLEFA